MKKRFLVFQLSLWWMPFNIVLSFPSPIFIKHHGSSFQKRMKLSFSFNPPMQNEQDFVQEIRSLRVKQIKEELINAGVDISDVFEKEELVQRLVAFRNSYPKNETSGKTAQNNKEDFEKKSNSSSSIPIESHIPLAFHSLTPEQSVKAKNDNHVFLRPSPGKFPSININLSNSDKSLTLLVDTACSGVVLRPNVVKKYSLPILNIPSTMQAAGGLTTGTSVSKIIRPRLDNGVELEDMMVAVQDIGALPLELDGIIGISFLQQFQYVAFDFENREMILRKTTNLDDSFNYNPLEEEVLAESNCNLCRIGVWTVDVTLDGRGPVKMLLDTGAASTFLNWKGAQDCSLKRDHPLVTRNRDPIGAMGADNMAIELSHRFQVKRRVNFMTSFSIGAFGPLGIDLREMDPLNIDIGDLQVLETLKADGVGGILGSDLLMRCDFLELDFLRGVKKGIPRIRMIKRRIL
jgi:predicted aspartyl protease